MVLENKILIRKDWMVRLIQNHSRIILMKTGLFPPATLTDTAMVAA